MNCKTIGLLLLTLCIYGTAQTQSTWHYLPQAPAANNRIDDVFFINEKEGWCATSWAKIFHTKDGGLSWELQYTGQQNVDYFRCIEFRDSLLGFAGTLGKKLLRTTDGGAHWINMAAQISPVPNAVCGVSVADSTTIYAVGEWDSPAFLLKSEDEGLTWTSKDMGAYANALVDVLFTNRDTGFVSGKSATGGVILYTTDGGATWTEKFNTQFSGEYIWKLQRVTPDVWVSSVQSWSATGRIIKSLDGGASWTAIPAPISDMQGIGFATPDHGWVGGYENGFYETTNGGLDWQLKNFGGNFNRFYFLSPTLGYASGKSIYKFTADSITGTITLPAPAPDPFDITIAPNPITNNTWISFDLPRTDIVRITAATPEGAEKVVLYNERLTAGHHRISLPTRQLTPGTWIICVQRNVGLYAGKVIKSL